jgi:glycine C-acetyltransferase
VRTIAGTMRIHMDLEEKIARFKNVEACVVFQSGFAANAGTVSAILGKDDFIISDELNHACRERRSWFSATKTLRTPKSSSQA